MYRGKQEDGACYKLKRYKAEIIYTAEYLNAKQDQLVNIVKSHESNRASINWTIKTAVNIVEELSQSDENSDTKQNRIQHMKERLGESLKKKWENKVMHGQYIRSIDRQRINEENMFLWPSMGDMKAET